MPLVSGTKIGSSPGVAADEPQLLLHDIGTSEPTLSTVKSLRLHPD
jgi:hypothetical protein